MEILRRERVVETAVNEEVHELNKQDQYGSIPTHKPDDAYRLMFENWNSLGVFTGGAKITKVNALVKKYQIDTLAGCETQCDWRQADKLHQFENLLAFGVNKRCQVGHNTTEKTVRDQKGGTAIATFGRLALQVTGSGCDHTGLGRWAWQLIGKGDLTTIVVVVYHPCDKNKNSKGFTTFQQHERYFQARGDFRSPRTILFEQLITQLRIWKSEGNEIILCGDFNENVYEGRMSRRLQERDILMTEQCLSHTGHRLPATFVTGTRPIDAVYATQGIETLNVGLLPKFGGVGDHRCFILDFKSASVMGQKLPRVLPPKGRKLNCHCERIRNSYNKALDQLAERHQMYRKLNVLTNLAMQISTSDFQVKMNRWDEELTDYMRAAEHQCHKFKINHIDWSPKLGVWKRRARLLLRISRYMEGKIRDPRNIIRACRTNQVCDPRRMSTDLLQVELSLCEKEMGILRAKSPAL